MADFHSMQIHRLYEDLHLAETAVTVGIFDGVHRGHRSLLDLLVKRAEEKNLQSAVVTFSSHPKMVLGNSGLQLLSTLEEKIGLLEKTGIHHLVIAEFSREFSNIGACDFVRNVLAGKLGARHLILGYNHRLGRSGEGTFDKIRQCTDPEEFSVEQAGGFLSGGTPVSSSYIREALRNGRIEAARELLGYDYRLSGEVVRGQKLGRLIGFPTANIRPADISKLVPGNGVYAVRVMVRNEGFMGMLSIGTNPTINPDSTSRSIEVHIIGFDSDIYGSNITVSFIKRLRNEKKFGSTSDLARQMEADKQETIRLLS